MFELAGVDIYLRSEATPEPPKEFGKFKLIFVSNRGTRIWPVGIPDFKTIDWPRCRYESEEIVSDAEIDALIDEISAKGFHWNKAQKLYKRDGEKMYSMPY